MVSIVVDLGAAPGCNQLCKAVMPTTTAAVRTTIPASAQSRTRRRVRCSAASCTAARCFACSR